MQFSTLEMLNLLKNGADKLAISEYGDIIVYRDGAFKDIRSGVPLELHEPNMKLKWVVYIPYSEDDYYDNGPGIR